MQCFLSENDCLTVGLVQISVLKIRHDSIKLGITDPNASPSYREEMLYIRNDDSDTDETDEVFEPIGIEEFSPFAISVL